ncbi:MAG TPA: nicotinamide riboside transporter PnuC [Patescibacteria group bacterium]|nr:nicotinamide riboside transporter PnuC [Patescibacteria group bacterium]
MSAFLSFFNVNTIAFTLFHYPMSWLELVGTVFNIWCVWLAARKNIWTWPIGLVGIICYLFLFYQIQLYSDLFEQVYFFIMTFYGWWIWARKPKQNEPSFVLMLTRGYRWIWGIGILAASFALTYFTSHLSLWFPVQFPQSASYPFLDAFTTIMSFAATYLMAKRYWDCWPLWITVDVIGIGLYFVKQVKFISLEYALFLILAIAGSLEWRKTWKTHRAQSYVKQTSKVEI